MRIAFCADVRLVFRIVFRNAFSYCFLLCTAFRIALALDALKFKPISRFITHHSRFTPQQHLTYCEEINFDQMKKFRGSIRGIVEASSGLKLSYMPIMIKVGSLIWWYYSFCVPMQCLRFVVLLSDALRRFTLLRDALIFADIRCIFYALFCAATRRDAFSALHCVTLHTVALICADIHFAAFLCDLL
jgi:hypothetical protein